MVRYDVVVVGGGCVGCSVAKHLVDRADISVSILEKEHRLAAHQSGRNSGVLHPGFNYPPGSMKARFATEGTSRMKVYARENDIPLEELGVVVVAKTAEEERRLEELQTQATQNGVDTDLISADALQDLEPHAAGRAALHAPGAASIDAQQYVYTLANEVRGAGVEIHLGHEVTAVEHTGAGHRIQTSAGEFEAKYLVNCAGLYADRIAHKLGVGEGYQVVPFRGEYYEIVPDRSHLCRSMIYPTPDPELPFLGVHFTRRSDGKVIVGPNAVLAFGREAYRNTQVNFSELAETIGFSGFWRLMADPKMVRVAWDELNKSFRKGRFVAAAQSLVPAVERSDVRRSFSGIRAQLVNAAGELVRDPRFESGPDSLHVLNAVSPGLTSSLPFGDHLATRVLDDLETV